MIEYDRRMIDWESGWDTRPTTVAALPECPTCGDPTDIAGRPCRTCSVYMRQVTRERSDRTETPPGLDPFDGELPF